MIDITKPLELDDGTPVSNPVQTDLLIEVTIGADMASARRLFGKATGKPLPIDENHGETRSLRNVAEIVWGDPIPVNGVRPAWLKGRVVCDIKTSALAGWRYPNEREPALTPAEGWSWDLVTKIRLPADHFAYTAIAAGFEPWGGGDAAPADWDRGVVLFGGASTSIGPQARWGWKWENLGSPAAFNIIGYRKRVDAQPAISDEMTRLREYVTWRRGDEQHSPYADGEHALIDDIAAVVA